MKSNFTSRFLTMLFFLLVATFTYAQENKQKEAPLVEEIQTSETLQKTNEDNARQERQLALNAQKSREAKLKRDKITAAIQKRMAKKEKRKQTYASKSITSEKMYEEKATRIQEKNSNNQKN